MTLTNLDKAVMDRKAQEIIIKLLEQTITNHAIIPLCELEVDNHLANATNCEKELMNIHVRILHTKPTAGEEAAHETILTDFSTRIRAVTSKLLIIKSAFPQPAPATTPAPPVHRTRLPDISLPSFDGKYEEWPVFEDLFKAAIDSKPIPACEKLQYLKTCLKGDAAQLVKAFTTTDANYAEAWRIVSEQYSNKREIIFSLVEKLISQQQVKTESMQSLQSLINTTTECLQSLKVFGRPIDTWDDLILVIILKKLDPDTRSEWARTMKGTDPPTFKDLQDFLQSHIRSLHARGSTSSKQPTRGFNGNGARTTSSSHHVSQSTATCKICNGREHPLYQCQTFMNQKIDDRVSTIRRIGNCLNCLRSGHVLKHCTSSSTCRKCGKQHHTLLHYNKSGRGSNSTSTQPPQDNTPQPTTQNIRSNTSSNYSSTTTQVLLKTAVVDIEDSSGNKKPCRVLLDDGSESSFMTDSCAKSLGLQREKTNVYITGISGSTNAHARWKVNVRIFSQVNDSFIDVESLILPKVTGTLPRLPCDPTSWSHLRDIRLADPHFCEPGDVDLLLGADVVALIMREGRRQGPLHTPIAQNTIFGWVVSGRVNTQQQIQIRSNVATCNLEKLVQKFWETEEPPAAQPLTPEEAQCEAHFVSTHSRLPDGRYMVRLPFKKDMKQIGDTRQQAVQRLFHLERRFKTYPHHHQEYINFMREYESLGHMELVTHSTATNNPIVYLPHHFVIKADSTTNKLRVVFDGSAKSSTGVSLNQTLMVGATIQDDLFSLLIRFRLHPIALMADIGKMYRQFKMHPEDSDSQRILWREDTSDTIKEYRLTTVTYGTAPAPFLATRSIVQLSRDEKKNFPTASQVLEKDSYVDDLMSGTSTKQKAIQLVQDLNKLVNTAGMEFRKWCTNDPDVLHSIPEELREKSNSQDFDTDDTVKALGVRWLPKDDAFQFQVNISKLATTKRQLLSDLARVFDPLGWLAPATIVGKLILQQLWTEKGGWDDKLSENIYNKWKLYQDNLPSISSLKIPRCIIQPHTTNYQLHGFCDSSEKAFSCAIYLRSTAADGTILIHLLTAKTRVAPLKQASLPRLELCGAKLLADCLESVKSSITIDNYTLFAWTDSTIVLRWISASSRRWKTYVANRVSHIQTLIPPEHWRHVRSEDNPADLPSRGTSPEELHDNTLWWHGPSWLQSNQFPVYPISANEEEIVVEERAKIHFASCHSTSRDQLYERISQHFSSWYKLSRATAYWTRFDSFLKNKCKQQPLSPFDIKEAQQQLILWVQQMEFRQDIINLNKHKEVSSHSKLKQLNPYIDQHGLLRVGGRLEHSSLHEDARHPIILPPHHTITKMIVNQTHHDALHSGFTLTLSLIRNSYFILRGRDLVRNLIRKCTTCRRHRAKTLTQLMGSLPKHRVTAHRPFLYSGVDFAGPFQVKMKKGRGAKSDKVWFAIFVCFTTKAIHLEGVSDLSTEAFIACYRRFVARRGTCSHLHSDCGTNFIGAEKELKRLLKQEQTQIQQQFTRIGTTFHFNPPAAPHQGGLWEAGVKQVKYHFRRVVGTTLLTTEQFQTLLCNIEACLNSRPLCALSSDPLDLEALTPGHFLVGSPLLSIPDPDVTHIQPNRLGYWQEVQQLNQRFWKRWHNEYLTTLQQRYKWTRKQDNPSVGDVVVIKDEQLPPSKWKLGRIVKLHPGADNLVRSATLKTISGELSRPITKLSPLIYNQNEA